MVENADGRRPRKDSALLSLSGGGRFAIFQDLGGQSQACRLDPQNEHFQALYLNVLKWTDFAQACRRCRWEGPQRLRIERDGSE